MLQTDFFDFIENLEREEKFSATTAAAATPNNINIDDTISKSSSIMSNRDSQTVDIWQDIAKALNNWTKRILDAPLANMYTKSRHLTSTMRNLVTDL